VTDVAVSLIISMFVKLIISLTLIVVEVMLLSGFVAATAKTNALSTPTTPTTTSRLPLISPTASS
jgi:hypothetical protein